MVVVSTRVLFLHREQSMFAFCGGSIALTKLKVYLTIAMSTFLSSLMALNICFYSRLTAWFSHHNTQKIEHQHFSKANIKSKENAKRKSIYGLAFSIQIQCLRTWTFAVYVPCKNLTKSKCIARKNLTCNLFIVLALEV